MPIAIAIIGMLACLGLGFVLGFLFADDDPNELSRREWSNRDWPDGAK